MTKSKVMLRSKDVAHILDCSPDSVVGLSRRGKLKGRKDGKYWKFCQEDVMTYGKEQEKSE